MELKWIGAVLIVAGCGGYGFSLASGYRSQERMLEQLLQILEIMETELQYRLTPLPALCRQASQNACLPLRSFFDTVSSLLETHTTPDVSSCVRIALSRWDVSHIQIRRILGELGCTLGQYDLAGQICGLHRVHSLCHGALAEHRMHRRERVRCYQTLGMCAGAGIVILFM